jgi:hypothetical protein
VDLPRKRGLAYTVTIGLAVLAAARDSKAGNPSFAAQLDYVATSGCPPVEVFESIVEGRLGYNPFRADAPNRVAVSVAANGHALEGRFEWRNTSGGSIGEQTFPSRSGDCRELTRAMGFALAVEIQVMAATGLESSLAPSAPLLQARPRPRRADRER